MKKIITVSAMLVVGLAVLAFGEPKTAITNYLSGAVFAHSFTNAGTTGLDTNEHYLCIAYSDLTNATGLTTNHLQVGTNGDVRVTMFALLSTVHDSYDALASTNQPDNMVVQEKANYNPSGGTGLRIVHTLTTKANQTGITIPDED
jgi:hypothetical protein